VDRDGKFLKKAVNFQYWRLKMALRQLLLRVGFLSSWAVMCAFVIAQDHPVIQPIPGFDLDDREFEDHASYTFRVEKDGQVSEEKIEGRYWFLYYEYTKGERAFSKLEIIKNYKQAALEKGGQILSEENDTKLDFSMPVSDGVTIWVHLHAWVDSYELYIIEEEAFEKRLELGAKEMMSQLKAGGRVAIYGIYFDFDKAELKPESEPTLQEITRLLADSPQLRLHVVGHTDNVGKFDYNLKLSRLRAEAVVEALVSKHGVARERLEASGVGPLAPMASNSTEEGRARNRRVELVEQ
jgi:OOP family OmpA-OmpF porin